MKKFLFTFLFTCVFMIFNNPISEATGLFYTNSSYPITATGSKVHDFSTLKKGTASATNIFYIVEFGDASIDKAVKDANIKKISFIDVNEKSVFIFWKKVTVSVYGE